jgi:hypothetical protein
VKRQPARRQRRLRDRHVVAARQASVGGGRVGGAVSQGVLPREG